jgi:alkanesulfonate monooxygenase SsuD/methylene tetrahydromethanopterin reductase-like flavin-dependent oxidoreductase (luciferase family)
MRVGIYLDLRNPPQWRRPWAEHYARTLELCEEADRLGAGSVWLSEHHLFEDGYLPQPLTFAAAVAARTSRVRIGTAVLLAALRHPAQIVEEANVVDLVSAGRLEVGIGAGYRAPEHAAFGHDLGDRYALVEDRIREIQRLWREGAVTPPPVQDPIPLWGGFQGPRGARLAGRLGMLLLTLDRRLLAPYREGLEAGGHPASSARMGGVVNLVVADDPETAWPRIVPHLAYQWDSYNRYMVEGTEQPVPRPIDPERWRAPGRDGAPPRFQVLTPEDAAQALRERTDGLPVEHVYLWASIAGMPDDLVDRHVELVAGTLAPMLA